MAELVGIVNLTPDSFSDGGNFFQPYYRPEKAVAYAEQLFEDGAAMVDIGAESTRPGAIPVDPETEWWRLEPVLTRLVEGHPDQISVDTRHPEIARRALEIGEVIINDVTGMNDPQMADTVAKYGARCIVSHMHGTDIQAAHKGKQIDDERVVTYDLLSRGALLVDRGLDAEKIILDPGIGFGKTEELNTLLVGFAHSLPDWQVMVGYSRKRFLNSKFVQPGEDRRDIAPNLRAGAVAIVNGASYLRVHDVAGHRQLF
jgi:dihydropteroate synthase